MAADQLADGRMEEDDLSARIDVFLGDHPELTGLQSAAPGGPRSQISEILKRDGDLAKTEAERQVLADRFVVWLGNLSSTARDSLLAGRMPLEELQSRLNVFAADIRAERNRVVSDPAVAAVPPIADAYEKANLGPVPERADSICFRATLTEGNTIRHYVLFKKRPNKVRMNIVDGDVVIGVLAFDGVTAWRQAPGRTPVVLQGADAESLMSVSRFDDPLVGYRDRGARARLESPPGASPIRLSIHEHDGSEVVETIDPVTYTELSIGWRRPNGQQVETRFGEYHKVGSLNLPSVQDELIDGVLHMETRITDVRLDAGVLDAVFNPPKSPANDFMDYMGGLAVIEKSLKANDSGSVQLPSGVSK
jgi:hypothetical protein